MATEIIPFETVLRLAEQYYAGTDIWSTIAATGTEATPITAEVLGQIPGVKAVKSASGEIINWTYTTTQSATSAAATIDSNAVRIFNNFEIPGLMSTDATGKLVMSSGVKTTAGATVKSVVAQVAIPIIATAVGIQLGKAIDSTLYNIAPDFWDEHGLSAINPDTWNDITRDDETLGARVMNVIFGLDPETQTATMYVDERIYGIIAKYLQEQGAYNTRTEITPEEAEDKGLAPTIPLSVPTYSTFAIMTRDPDDVVRPLIYKATNGAKFTVVVDTSSVLQGWYLVAAGPRYFEISVQHADDTPSIYGISYYATLYGDPLYQNHIYSIGGAPIVSFGGSTLRFARPLTEAELDTIKYIIQYGTSSQSTVPGITDQPDAIQIDIDDDDDDESAQEKIEIAFPEIWENEVDVTSIDADGNIGYRPYVPVPVPQTDAQGKPISGTQTQGDTEVDPQSNPQTKQEVARPLDNPPSNPPDTGEGISPIILPPSGSASALFTAYAPSQAQLDAFGAWLWSTNFVDQLLKLFNDPMQAIIGLHKCYCPVPTGGAQNIKVGYLDSGVSAATVSSQYTTVDCGTVSMPEYFGNVFDYDPHTKMHLYLPFIGIVPLNTADVMRGNVNVTYHFDVLTGACLAEVSVFRDLNAGGVLYTYSGNCASQYPLSSGSYMGIVSGILGIAGGVAATVASGGALAPMALGAANAALNMRTNVQHSGTISGNAGVMGVKTPYIIVTRPQTQMATNFETLQGYPANEYTTLAQCSGYVQIDSVHVEGISATDQELTEIETLLKSGVIV